MSSRYLDNHYENYTSEAASHIFNFSTNGISKKMEDNLRKYKLSKMNFLMTNLKNYIFHDGTVYTGSAGLALYYIMCANKNDGYQYRYLKEALPYIDVDNLKGRRISFLCGDAGPLAIGAVLSYRLGDLRSETFPDYRVLIERLKNLICLLDDSPDELLYGKAGYLYALLFVNRYIGEQNGIPEQHIKQVVNAILASGKKLSQKMKSDCPLLFEWHGKVYFGGAHGIGGILYLLLQARDYMMTKDLNNYVKSTLDWLLDKRFVSGNIPSSMGSPTDRLVQWCHGAPGFVPLCIKAYQVFKEHQYLKYALEMGDLVWQRGLCSKGYSLCHGVAGNTYTFLQLYQATEKQIHLYRAYCFMDWCMAEKSNSETHKPDRPASLFEGLLGRIYLADELLNIKDAKFPAYTV